MTRPHPGAIYEPTKSHLIRRKDTHITFITQESPRVFGALCQKTRTKTKYLLMTIVGDPKPGSSWYLVSSWALILLHGINDLGLWSDQSVSLTICLLLDPSLDAGSLLE